MRRSHLSLFSFFFLLFSSDANGPPGKHGDRALVSVPGAQVTWADIGGEESAGKGRGRLTAT